MKKKIVSLSLVILLLGVVVSGCYPTEKINELEAQIVEKDAQITEQGEQIAGLEDQIVELEDQVAERETQIVELEGELAEASAKLEEQAALMARIAELEEEIVMIELNLEELREPPLQVPSGVKVVGFLTHRETINLLEKLFPKSARTTSAYTKGPYPLVNLGLVEAFLAEDRSNIQHNVYPIDAGDRVAFQFKARWIAAGLPPWSLGLLKVERTVVTFTGSTKQLLVWRNIFLTVENGEYVVYEVVPQTDELIKIETPALETHCVIISDRL